MTQPQKSLAGWLVFLGQAEIPVLKQTARELDRLKADENLLDARGKHEAGAQCDACGQSGPPFRPLLGRCGAAG